MKTLKPKSKRKKKDLQFAVVQARYDFTDSEKSRLGLDASRSQSEISTYEQQLQSIKSDYKGKIESAECKRNECFRKIEDGFEMRQVQAVIEFFPEKKTKRIYRLNERAKTKKGEFLREEDMTPADFHRELPLDEPKEFVNPVLTGDQAKEVEEEVVE